MCEGKNGVYTENFTLPLEMALHCVGTLKSKWPGYSDEEKAEILHIMTKGIILGQDGSTKDKRKSVNIKWEEPWATLIKFSNKLGPTPEKWHARQDSNLRSSDS